MKDVIEKAIAELTKKSSEAKEAHHAMSFAQAALNLAHALKTISSGFLSLLATFGWLFFVLTL